MKSNFTFTFHYNRTSFESKNFVKTSNVSKVRACKCSSQVNIIFVDSPRLPQISALRETLNTLPYLSLQPRMHIMSFFIWLGGKRRDLLHLHQIMIYEDVCLQQERGREDEKNYTHSKRLFPLFSFIPIFSGFRIGENEKRQKNLLKLRRVRVVVGEGETFYDSQFHV